MPLCTRPLDTIRLLEQFLINALDERLKDSDLTRLLDNERAIAHLADSAGTLDDKALRSQPYVDEDARAQLHEQIVDELFNLPREKDDENIGLKRGGAMPLTKIQRNKKAYIITGLPASGKSKIASRVADRYGAYILDSDFAKRKIPEFFKLAGAAIVHEESDELVHGAGDIFSGITSLAELCILDGCNVVMPLIGHKLDKVQSTINSWTSLGYEVHLTLVGLDRRKSTRRALNRFLVTNRYVSLARIFDYYCNEPTITFYRLFCQGHPDLSSIGKVSTDVEHGTAPTLISSEPGNPAFWISKSTV